MTGSTSPQIPTPPDVPTPETAGPLRSLPRRAFLTHRVGETAPPQMRVASFHGPWFTTLRSLVRCGGALLAVARQVANDQLHGRNTRRQRAIHLRRAVQDLGGQLVRIAQRLAVRADLRQSPYGEELTRLSDATPPFPAETAVAAIERTTGAPLYKTFAQFDPTPVVSTPSACVYQAILLSGERVVAKVRRPGAGEQLAADLRLVDWVARTLELFSFVRQGYTRDLRRDLREALLEEFDFVREARHQAAFRRSAKRTGRKFFTAPRVYFELSGDEVVVQEFASGMWLWELIAAVEHDDQGGLELARSLNIDPVKVARRLLWVSFWSWQENLFFLAEPTPHNIIVGANGRLFFIDFTSTGAVDHTMKRAMAQNMYYAQRRDALNMARACLTLLEPLPPVDVISLTKEIENASLQMLYAFETRHRGPRSQLRSTLTQWRGLLDAAGRFGIVVDHGVIRLIRAAVTHESLALRLAPGLDIIREYRRFERGRADRSADPGGRHARERWRSLFDRRVYIQLEHMAKAGEGFLFRLRHLLSLPRVNFSAMISKSSFTFVSLVHFVTQAVQLTVLAWAVVAARQVLAHQPITLATTAYGVSQSGIYRALLAVLLLINVRALLFRLDDKDV